MKLSLFKKVCLTVMGVGMVSSLMSVGTFATFTATAANQGNTFAAGTLLISSAGSSSAAYAAATTTSGLAGPNLTGSSLVGSGAECTNVVVTACKTLIDYTQVTAYGFEPGQYAQTSFHMKNTGTLPGAMSVQIENVSTQVNAAGGATGSFSICPSDIATSATDTGQGSACVNLGDGLNVTLQTNGGSAGGTQCLYGAAGNVATSAFSASAPDATHSDMAFAGSCDTITANGNANTTGLNLAPGSIVKSACGASPNYCVGDPVTKFFSSLGGVGSNGVWIGGSLATSSTTFSTPKGGTVKRWMPGEDQTFTLTIAMPDQGAITKTSGIGVNNVSVGNDNIYQGGQIKFDLVWFLQQ